MKFFMKNATYSKALEFQLTIPGCLAGLLFANPNKHEPPKLRFTVFDARPYCENYLEKDIYTRYQLSLSDNPAIKAFESAIKSKNIASIHACLIHYQKDYPHMAGILKEFDEHNFPTSQAMKVKQFPPSRSYYIL